MYINIMNVLFNPNIEHLGHKSVYSYQDTIIAAPVFAAIIYF